MEDCKHETWSFPAQPVRICDSCERTSAEIDYERRIDELEAQNLGLIQSLRELEALVASFSAVDKARQKENAKQRELMQELVSNAEFDGDISTVDSEVLGAVANYLEGKGDGV